ncbi:MAG TPA: GNAT family N-acetyltransferase [Bacteroidales bacterium]|nr:GNAT family N-acetyltransferase [Bacteroidales bacterium]
MNEPNMKDFIIRDYRDEDYNEVIELWGLTGMGRPERGDDRETIERCNDLGGRLLLLEDKLNNKIAGSSWMTFDGRRVYMHHFGILPEYQGKGLSKPLLEESLEHVRDKGFQVKLEVHSTNIKAIELYKKYEFEYLGDYRVFIIRDIDKRTSAKI